MRRDKEKKSKGRGLVWSSILRASASHGQGAGCAAEGNQTPQTQTSPAACQAFYLPFHPPPFFFYCVPLACLSVGVFQGGSGEGKIKGKTEIRHARRRYFAVE